MNVFATIRSTCVALSIALMLAGVAGMGLSFVFLLFSSTANLIIGAAGFVAGAVFIGAGIISLSILAVTPHPSTIKDPRFPELA